MTLEEYARCDGVALAALVASRQVTPLELVELAATAAERVQGELNFIAHDLTDMARDTARNAVPRGAMFGVPFLLKDLALEMKGTPYEAGCRLLKGNVSTIDTNLMTRFREAGLMTIAKTTCAEFGAQIATETALNGVTRNPWNPDHTPGGSSGGSAAAVAAGVVPVAHANDGIGSIRIPASNCGLFGLKPNRHRIPIGPVMGDAPGSRGVEFVVSRSVRDSAVLLDQVHGADTGAQAWAPPPARRYVDELERPRTGLRIAVQTRSFSGAKVDAECAAAVQATAALCEALGHHVEEDAPRIDFVAFRRAIRHESNANSLAGLAMAAAAMGRPIDATTVEPFTLAIYEDGRRTSGEDVARAAQPRNRPAPDGRVLRALRHIVAARARPPARADRLARPVSARLRGVLGPLLRRCLFAVRRRVQRHRPTRRVAAAAHERRRPADRHDGGVALRRRGHALQPRRAARTGRAVAPPHTPHPRVQHWSMTMTALVKINPDALFPPPGNKHAHVVIAPAGGRTAYLAGQVALDRDGNIVGGRDHAAQIEQVFVNIRDTLAAIGAGPDRLVQMTIIVVDHSDALLPVINAAGERVFGAEWPVTATTLIGAQALGHSAFLVEVNAIAALVD